MRKESNIECSPGRSIELPRQRIFSGQGGPERTARLSRILISMHLASTLCVATAGEFQYFPATVENTTLADGTPLEFVNSAPDSPEQITRGPAPAQPNQHWQWRENKGSGATNDRGVFAAAGNHGNDAPMLRTTIAGLKPKSDYRVYGCFWIAGYSSDTATPSGNSLWDIRLGCALSEMMGYGYKANPGFPVTIQSGNEKPWGDGLRDKDEDRRMLGANLGTVRTDSKGSLIVYVDDQPGDIHQARTWFDGVCVLPATDKAQIGAGAPGALHRAVRCADWEIVRRELEAGADINALDRDGLTPLFYACVNPDLQRIQTLLKAGAMPDVHGQALSPLWVAATAGRADLAALLLESSAKVPADPLPADPMRAKFKINARAHPAVAAICSGSTPVLKLLLEKEPELDLDRLYSSDYDPKANNHSGYPYAVLDAVLSNHPEMAEYLISLGCQIKGEGFFKNLPRRAHRNHLATKNTGSRGLLVAAVIAGPQMHGVVTALSRRGMPLVDDDFIESDFSAPWDALSAAALAGDAVVTRQLLSKTEGVGQSYKTNLIAMAHSGGNREVITTVQNRFSDVRIPRWQGEAENDQENRITDNARVFKLRQVPFIPRSHHGGERVLAVISDPASAGPAASITAKASEGKEWICVEREHIESLLRESQLAKPWDDAAQDMSGIGDQLAADLLIIVSRLESKDLNVLRFEAVDVRSGLPIDRLHIDEKNFKPDVFCGNYLEGIRNRLEERLSGKELTAVTLLPITADQSLGGSATLEGMLHAGLLQKIDQTPGMIALTRDQMQPLAEEKVLGHPGKFVGAAWTIEGGLRPLDRNRVELALRVRSLGKDGLSHDVKTTGGADDVLSLVRNAWNRLSTIIQRDPAPNANANDERAGNEAARLMREAEWLHHLERNHDAASLVDSALYLGADPMKANMLRMKIHMAKARFRVQDGSMHGFAGPIHVAPLLPVSALWADEASAHLQEYLELLRVNSECLDRVANLISDKSYNNTSAGPLHDFLWNMGTLVFYRSSLKPGLMTAENAAFLEEFDSGLERHIKRLFGLIQHSKQGCDLLMNLSQFGHIHFNAVPALSDALAEAIVRVFDCADFQKEYPIAIFSSFIDAPYMGSNDKLVPDRSSMMCDSLEKAITRSNSPFKKLRLAEIRFLRSSGEQRTACARELIDARISTMSTIRKLFVDWVPPYELARWSPMPTSDIYFNPEFDLRHGDSLIPSLLHTPGTTPDQIFRQSHYTTIAARLFSIRQGKSFAGYYSAGWLTNHLETRMNRMVEGNEPASEFDNLLSSARLIDRLMGVNVTNQMEPKILRVRPGENRKSFGSRNQFPIVEYEGAIKGGVLVDLRSGITDKPAMFNHSVVDPKDHHILWGVLQPYEDLDFKLNRPTAPDGSTPRFAIGNPWLLAVDCRDGTIVHKINLAKASGHSKTTSLWIGFGSMIDPEILFNDTHLFIRMYWLPDENTRSTPSILLVNRKTGAVDKLEEPLQFFNLSMPNSQQPYDAVAGVGDSFFVVETKPGQPESSLWRVRPGRKPELIAKSGRRPEESPFDAQDRAIRYINNDGGKLVAASSWGHFGRFDLQSGTWTADPERNDAQGKGFVETLERRDYHATLFPHHLFKHEGGKTDAFGAPWTSKPGQLEFEEWNGPTCYLPVDLRIPDSYLGRFQVLAKPLGMNEALPVDNKGDLEYEWVRVTDYARSLSVRPGILNQTDSHFVLGTQIIFWMSHHVDPDTYLPFLWAIDKAEMSAGMKRAVKK